MYIEIKVSIISKWNTVNTALMRREINRRNFFTYTVSLWKLNTNISLVKNEQLHSILINTVSPELISSLNYYSLKYTKKFLIKFIIKIFLLYHFLTYLSFLDKDAQITLKNKRATIIRDKKILAPNRFEIKSKRGSGKNWEKWERSGSFVS